MYFLFRVCFYAIAAQALAVFTQAMAFGEERSPFRLPGAACGKQGEEQIYIHCDQPSITVQSRQEAEHIDAFSSNLKHLVGELVEKNDFGMIASLLENIKSESFRHAFEEVYRLSPELKRSILVDSPFCLDCCDENNLKLLEKMPRVSSFIESVNELINKKNPHYAVHLVVNTIIYSCFIGAGGCEPGYIMNTVYRDSQATVMVENVSSVCAFSLSGAAVSSIRGVLVGGFFERIMLTPMGLISNILIGGVLVLGPAVTRPLVMPVIFSAYACLFRKQFSSRKRKKLKYYEISFLSNLSEIINNTHIEQADVIAILQQAEADGLIDEMTEAVDFTKSFVLWYSMLDDNRRQILLEALPFFRTLPVTKKESKVYIGLFNEILKIDKEHRQKQWNPSICTSTYKICSQKQYGYLGSLSGSLVFVISTGAIIIVYNCISPYINVALHSEALIYPPPDFNETCLAYNVSGGGLPIVISGEVAALEYSIAGSALNQMLNLLVDIVLPSAGSIIQVSVVGACSCTKAVFSCFYRCIRRNPENSE